MSFFKGISVSSDPGQTKRFSWWSSVTGMISEVAQIRHGTPCRRPLTGQRVLFGTQRGIHSVGVSQITGQDSMGKEFATYDARVNLCVIFGGEEAHNLLADPHAYGFRLPQCSGRKEDGADTAALATGRSRRDRRRPRPRLTDQGDSAWTEKRVE